MTANRPTKPRKQYKRRGPETWAVIRESYLAGASARVLAERYDVTDWAIWRRAWKEGWTKDRRVEPPPRARESFGSGRPSGTLTRLQPADLQADAAAASARALHEGRVDEALRWSKLAESYGRLVKQRPWMDVEG